MGAYLRQIGEARNRGRLAALGAGDSFPDSLGRNGGSAAMMTAIGITLLVGVGLGVVLGVPLGRTIERVRPGKGADKSKKKKPRP